MKTMKILAIFMFALLIACSGKSGDIYDDYTDDDGGSSGKSDSDKNSDSDKGSADDSDDSDSGIQDGDSEIQDEDPTDSDDDSKTDGDKDASDGDSEPQDSDSDESDDDIEIPDAEIDVEKAVYVDRYNGDDANEGTKTKPVKTLVKAIELSSPFDRNSIVLSWGVFDNMPALKNGSSSSFGSIPLKSR